MMKEGVKQGATQCVKQLAKTAGCPILIVGDIARFGVEKEWVQMLVVQHLLVFMLQQVQQWEVLLVRARSYIYLRIGQAVSAIID